MEVISCVSAKPKHDICRLFRIDGDDDLIENPRPVTPPPTPTGAGASCKIRQNLAREPARLEPRWNHADNFRHIERYYLKGREKY